MPEKNEKFDKEKTSGKDSRDEFLKSRFEDNGGLDSIYKGDPFDRAVHAIMLIGYSEKEGLDILQDETNPYTGALLDVLGGMPENGYRIDPGSVIRESVFRFGRNGGALMYVLPDVRRGINWKRKIYPELIQILEDFGYEYRECAEIVWGLAGMVKKEMVADKDYVYSELSSLVDKVVYSAMSYYDMGSEGLDKKVLSKIGIQFGMPDGLEQKIRVLCDKSMENLKPRLEKVIPYLKPSEYQTLIALIYNVFRGQVLSLYVLPNDPSIIKELSDLNKKLNSCLSDLEAGVDSKMEEVKANRVFRVKSSVKISESATQELFDKLVYMPYSGLKRTRSGRHLLARFERELFSAGLN